MSLRVGSDQFGSTCTARRAPWPLGAAIPAEHCADCNHNPEHYSLNSLRHDENRLRPTMPQGGVGKIKQRWSIGRTRVDYFEYGLEVLIEIDDGTYPAVETEGFGAVVPPPVRNAARKVHVFAAPERQLLRIDLSRQRAAGDDTVFILEVMDMQRGTLPPRWQRAAELQPCFSTVLLAPHVEHFTGVSVLQAQDWQLRTH